MSELPIIQKTLELLNSKLDILRHQSGWEFVGRVEQESRSVPVMSVTASENQPGWGSLVGSPNGCLIHQYFERVRIYFTS